MSAGEIREQLFASADAIQEAVTQQHVVNDKMIALGQLSAGIRTSLATLEQQLAACEELLGENTALQVAAKSKIDESVSGVTTVADGTSQLDHPIGLLNSVSQGSQEVIGTTRLFGEHLPKIKDDVTKMAVYVGSFVERVNGIGQVASKNITSSLTAKATIEDMAARL